MEKAFCILYCWLLLGSYLVFAIVILGHVAATTTMWKCKALGPSVTDVDGVEGEAFSMGAEAFNLVPSCV